MSFCGSVEAYFFQFYLYGDFHNRIWQSYESYDQPELTEYSYGAWLYPLYIKEKKAQSSSFDYTKFLIKNGFYEIDNYYMNTYASYKTISNVIRFDDTASGSPAKFVAQYGSGSLKPINIIYYAREVNVLLLASAVIFAYFLYYIT